MDILVFTLLSVSWSILADCHPLFPFRKYYSIHSSCSGVRRAILELAISDALNWALIAAEQTKSPRDNFRKQFQQEQFSRLFADSSHREYSDILARVLDVLQGGNDLRGIAGMIEYTDRTKDKDDHGDMVNYKFYCDNDIQNEDRQSPGRWKLKEDPPGTIPVGMTPNRDRPHFNKLLPAKRKWEPFQEWVDVENGLLMGKTAGCQETSTLYLVRSYTLSLPEVPYNESRPRRATITVCDTAFDRPEALLYSSLGTLDHFDGSLFRYPDERSPSEFRMNDSKEIFKFRRLLSFHLLQEILSFPPWEIKDDPIITTMITMVTDPASSWRAMQALKPENKVNNRLNYVWFGFLGALADHGWRLKPGPRGTMLGLLRFDSLLRSI